MWWYTATVMMIDHYLCDDTPYICDDNPHICDDNPHICDDNHYKCDDIPSQSWW